MSYLDQLNASPKFEIFSPEKPKHSYFLKITSSFLPIFVLALGLGAALILIRDRQKVTTKASLETTNLFMLQETVGQTGDYVVSIFAATSSGKLVAIEMPIIYSNDLLDYVPDYVPSSNLPNLLPGSVVTESTGQMTFIVAAPPDSPMTPAGLVGTIKFRSKGIAGVAHIAFGAVRIAGLNSQNEPLSENLAGTLTGIDITIAGPTATPTITPTPTTPITITVTNTPTPTSPTATIGASPTPTSSPTPTTPAATATIGASPTPTATATPTIGTSPTPTERPYNNCGGTCGSNMNCKGELYCYFPDPKNHPFDGVCRNPFCDQSTDCNCPTSPTIKPTATLGASPTVKPTAKPTLRPTIVPTVTTAPTPFIVKISSPTPIKQITPITQISPTSIPNTEYRVPNTNTPKESGWWERFVEWLRSLLGK